MIFAWDGLSFRVPNSWELISLEHTERARTARFAGSSGAERLFLRWSRIKGRFNVASHLGQVLRAVSKTRAKTRFVVDEGWKASRSQRKKLKKLARSLVELRFDGRVELPGAKKALKAMDYAAFAWEDPSAPRQARGGLSMSKAAVAATATECEGRGVVGYSAGTSKAFLIHFIGASLGEQKTVWSSFAEAAGADDLAWSAHGLRFRAPKEFICTGLGYDPKGLFQVRLKKGKALLHASRWSLANVLLKRASLGQFFKESFKKLIKRHSVSEEEGDFRGHDCLRFRPASRGILSRALARLRKAVPLGGPHFLGGLLWRCPSSNRILAFYALGRDESVCALSEKAASTCNCCGAE